MTTSEQPRTAAATRAVVRRGEETKAAALREAGWLVIAPEPVHDAATALDSIPAGDPETAHDTADEILLALVPPKVAAAYRRLAKDRCACWATA